MSDRNWKALRAREEEVDALLNIPKGAVYHQPTHSAHRLEKTIIVAAAAIVEAIWKART